MYITIIIYADTQEALVNELNWLYDNGREFVCILNEKGSEYTILLKDRT